MQGCVIIEINYREYLWAVDVRYAARALTCCSVSFSSKDGLFKRQTSHSCLFLGLGSRSSGGESGFLLARSSHSTPKRAHMTHVIAFSWSKERRVLCLCDIQLST